MEEVYTVYKNVRVVMKDLIEPRYVWKIMAEDTFRAFFTITPMSVRLSFKLH